MSKLGWVIIRAHNSVTGTAFYMEDGRTWSKTKHKNISKIPDIAITVNPGNLFKEHTTLSYDYQSFGWEKTPFGVRFVGVNKTKVKG